MSLQGCIYTHTVLPEGISILTWWGGGGLRALVTLRAMLAVAYLLVASPKPDRSIWVGTRQREIPWSSRLGVGREANNLTR
jgi:hypothetical protein